MLKIKVYYGTCKICGEDYISALEDINDICPLCRFKERNEVK